MGRVFRPQSLELGRLLATAYSVFSEYGHLGGRRGFLLYIPHFTLNCFQRREKKKLRAPATNEEQPHLDGLASINEAQMLSRFLRIVPKLPKRSN